MDQSVLSYNSFQQPEDKTICDYLAKIIDRELSSSMSKVWHGHPVWFIDDNPIVGYDKLKDCVRLLFWSGQSFDEPGLTNEGNFKAAEARYTELNQVNEEDLIRWLEKAKKIQWDYKNIVKRKGLLKKLEI
jgi:hypothetical protein